MLNKYFKFAFRSLRRNKRHSIINILGLAVAMAAFLVIFLVVNHEYSYDTFHKNAANVYQLVKNDIGPDGNDFDVSTPFPMIQALRNDYPQLTFAQLYSSHGSQITVMNTAQAASEKKFIEPSGIFYAEPEIFRLFDVKWLSGSTALLQNDNTVILSKAMANKYFSSWQNAEGKYLRIDNIITARVAGIIDDMPANTDFPFKVIFSYRTFLSNVKPLGRDYQDRWSSASSNHQIYVLLPTEVKPETVNASLVNFVNKYFEAPKSKSLRKVQFLQPLHNIHFDTRFSNNGTHIISKSSLYTLSFIGVLILLMACINFINLSTALAVKRSKEVGIRKVMGSSSKQLTVQVLVETFVIVLLSTGIALLLAYMSLPYLKYIVQVEETLPLFTLTSVLFLSTAVIITTLLSASYPALVLSRFKPVEAMKNKINTTQWGGVSLRRVLVVLQFSFSQILVIATIVALNQMHFIQNADLGFNKEAVLLLRGNTDSASLAKHDAFKASLLQLPGVQSVSFSYDAPASTNSWDTEFGFDNVATDKDFGLFLKPADADYQKTFGLKMAAGTFYGNDTLPDVVINETLVAKLGLKEPHMAIGKTLRIGSGGRWRTIVGVVKDFKSSSLKQAVPPTVLFKSSKRYSLTAIKLQSNNLSKSNATIQSAWESYFPEYAYNSTFFDDNINQFYIQEQRMSILYKLYACLAIFISCLGLYGLVSFMVIQKFKEVGIRKVLGASVANIIYLFSKEFTILIGIAFLIAVPVGYYMMNSWLEDFVFRVDIGIGVFIIALFTSMVIAWITVGYKAISAALANPVKSLKTE